MQTETKRIEINRYDHHYYQSYLKSKLKEFETLGIDEQYSLNVSNFGDDEEKEIKRIFETVFVK